MDKLSIRTSFHYKRNTYELQGGFSLPFPFSAFVFCFVYYGYFYFYFFFYFY